MKWKIKQKNYNQDMFFKTDDDLRAWYDNTLLAQYESIYTALDAANDTLGGYYIGLGYTLYKLDNQPKTLDDYILKANTPKCLHSRKYLNRISNSLQFVVCPDCRMEIK